MKILFLLLLSTACYAQRADSPQVIRLDTAKLDSHGNPGYQDIWIWEGKPDLKAPIVTIQQKSLERNSKEDQLIILKHVQLWLDEQRERLIPMTRKPEPVVNANKDN